MRLGELLVRDRVATAAQVEEALSSQVLNGGRLGTNLVELGHLTEEALARALGKLHGVPSAHGEIVPSGEALASLDLNLADDRDVLPVRLEGNRLFLLVINPDDIETRDRVAQMTGKRVVPVVVPEFRMAQLQRRYCKAFRPVREVDIEAVRRKQQRAQQAAARAPSQDLMAEDEFESLYAAAMQGGVRAGEEQLEEAVVIEESQPMAPIAAPPAPAPRPQPVAGRLATPPPQVRVPTALPRQPSSVPTPTSLPRQPSSVPTPTSLPRQPTAVPIPAALPRQPSSAPAAMAPVAAPQPASQRPASAAPTAPIAPIAPAAGELPTIDLELMDIAQAEPERTPERSQEVSRRVASEKRAREQRVEDSTPIGFAEAQKALAQISDRGDIGRVVLRFAAGKFKRAILLNVQRDMAIGWLGAGSALAAGAARKVAISLKKQSPFKLVRDSRSHFLGPLRKEFATVVFLKGLGGGEPKTAVLMPLLAAGRVVNILYCDNGPDQFASLDIGELLILAQSVGRSYESMLAARKAAAKALHGG